MLSLTGVAVAVVLTAVGITGAAAAAAPKAAAQTQAPVTGFWYAIGDTPSTAEIDAVAAHYSVIVLNPWETAALRRIKQVAPATKVLAYKDLSSTRSYSPSYTNGKDAAILPSGVGYAQASTNPAWFATDRAGRRIEWGPYPGHWQMAVWDIGYQQAWAARTVSELAGQPWDGVLADNDMANLGFYSSAVLTGTTDAAGTNAKIRAGLDGLITVAGPRLNSAKLLLVVNISEARLYPGRWEAHSRFGGGMEENFVKFGSDPETGFVSDWGATGWKTIAIQATHSDRIFLSMTRTAGGARAARYGWATTMLAAPGSTVTTWAPSVSDDYRQPPESPLFVTDLGKPLAAATEIRAGVWARQFAGGMVVVNATTGSTTVTLPKAYRNSAGTYVTSVTLPATDAAILLP